MNDKPPDRSLAMLLSQGILLIAGLYSSVAVVLTLLNGTSNPVGFGLYVSLVLVLPAISLVAFLRKSPNVHKLSILSLLGVWGWILRMLWIWSGLTPAGIWETSTVFQAVLLLLTVFSLGIPILVAKLELERRSAATLAENTVPLSHSQTDSDPYLINSPIAFDDSFFSQNIETTKTQT